MRQIFALALYRLLFLILLPLMLLLLVIRSKNNKQYRQRLSERLGLINSKMKPSDVVIHAASVGEVLALKPFIEQLLKAEPDLSLTFTTFTPTGSAQVQKQFAQRVQHCYLPLDIWPCTTLFLHVLKPKVMVFMETEIWPNLISQCQQQSIKLLLINGRLSTKSMHSYQKLAWLIKPSLAKFAAILCQSEENYHHFIQLGANKQTCEVSGNLKFDLQLNQQVSEKASELHAFIPQARITWLAASTHPGDEEIILKSFDFILQKFPQLLLILVPRHPERFEQVAQLCQQKFNTVKRSSKQALNSDSNIWLLDSLGELLPAFSLANIVTMGGSFSNIGGHNPLEPALFKLPIVVGPDMSNFNEIMQQMQSNNAIIQLKQANDMSSELSNNIIKLLADNVQAKQIGNNAYQVVKANQGASQRSIAALQKLLIHQQ